MGRFKKQLTALEQAEKKIAFKKRKSEESRRFRAAHAEELAEKRALNAELLKKARRLQEDGEIAIDPQEIWDAVTLAEYRREGKALHHALTECITEHNTKIVQEKLKQEESQKKKINVVNVDTFGLLPKIPKFIPDERKMIILVGVPGSGKSYFSNMFMKLDDSSSNPKQWVYINQDILGARCHCIYEAKQGLCRGKNVLIDRTNIDRVQRSYWTDIAHEHGLTHIHVIYFNIPHPTVLQRLQAREDHPTLTSPDKAIEIFNLMSLGMEPPSKDLRMKRTLCKCPPGCECTDFFEIPGEKITQLTEIQNDQDVASLLKYYF